MQQSLGPTRATSPLGHKLAGASRRATAGSCRALATETVDALAAAPPGLFLDEEELLMTKISAEQRDALIAQAKLVLLKNFGASQPELLAESFKFVAPVVGPLSKEEFTTAFSSFDLMEALPDLKNQYHAFRVDPWDTSRVWFVARAQGTHTGYFAKSIPPSGKKLDSPPQACSLSFDSQLKCTQLTVGYVMDKQIGNTGGLGGVFGVLYAIGAPLPFPEAQPWSMSPQYWMFNQVGGLAQKLASFGKK